jgi:DNA-binding NtrC family response regulator
VYFLFSFTPEITTGKIDATAQDLGSCREAFCCVIGSPPRGAYTRSKSRRHMTRVLVYDPDALRAGQTKDMLEGIHLSVVSSGDATAAQELLQKQFFHLILWSVENFEQISILAEVRHRRPESAVVVTSSQGDPALVVACMRSGSSHFWQHRDGNQKFLETVNETLGRVLRAPVRLEDVDFPLPQFVGRHQKMLEVFELIQSVKESDSTVLITGESGTGKEVVAAAIHNLSPRRRHPWIAVNCGAIPINLLESELFGHVKGAFTGATQNRNGRFQLAKEGTLFLDEITDLPLDLQSKILRAIQNKIYEPVGSAYSLKLDARIIAATNQNLDVAVAEKRFREDLFYRLNVIPIHLPPLRARKSDIPLLVKYFLDRFTQTNNKRITGISEEAMQCLMEYHWPGNIRELENLVERVVVLKRTEGIIELRDFPPDYFRNVRLDRFVANVALPEDGLDFNSAVNDFENELILQALQRTSGNKNRAATLLNLNRTTLVEKLKRKRLRVAV